MSRVDWTVLGTSKRGLAVEGPDDKTVIEAFLDAGEIAGHWSDWRSQLIVSETGGNVLRELDDNRVWGLIDRDWRTDDEVAQLQTEYPHLLVLPRVTIENYCIDPIELNTLLPPAKRVATLEADIEVYRDIWVQNGALWQVLYERGAHDFCRGRETGYPNALLYRPVTRIDEIRGQFEAWYGQLDPQAVIILYEQKLADFRQDRPNHYRRYIHGKLFFSQVIVGEVFKRHFGQRKERLWFSDLFSGVSSCPADIVPVLSQVVT